MLNFQIQASNRIPKMLKFFFICILIMGIFVRFHGLDKKIYWLDEVATSFRVAGSTISSVTQKLYTGDILSVSDLQYFQRPDPEKSWLSTIDSLIVDDAQHPPLYFVMIRFWAEFIGHSPALIRTLSVLLSLLIFPCFYWLCIELFNSAVFGWIAISSTSFSLLHIIYAQEAREYSLWIVTILFASAAFLKFIRTKTKLDFSIYTFSIIVGLYTFPFTGIVMIGHGIYLLIIEKFRFSKVLNSFLASSFISIVSYIPWIWTILTNRSRVQATTSWMFVDNRSLIDLINIWLVNITHVFVHYSRFRLIFLIILIFAFCVLYSKVRKKIWLFIASLMFPTLIIFSLVDLVSKSGFSFYPRYMWPFLLGTQLVFSCIVGYMLNSQSHNNWIKNVGIIFFALMIILGINTSVLPLFQGANDNQFDLVASLINKQEAPLVVSFINEKPDIAIGDIGDVFSLSYLVEDKSKFLLFKQPNTPKLTSNKFDKMFIFYAYQSKVNKNLPDLSGIERQGYQIQPIVLKEGERTILWEIKPNSNM